MPEPIQFHIVHSHELPRGEFHPLEQTVALGREKVARAITALDKALETASEEEAMALTGKRFEVENKLAGFNQHTSGELQELAAYLSQQGIRRVAHCGNGTYAMVFDLTDDQVLRISVGDERESEPEFAEPQAIAQIGRFKIEVFPKLDFDSLDLETDDLELQQARADAMDPVHHSLRRRGIFTMDITGNNNALLKDGTPINGDPGNGVLRVNLDLPEENWSGWDRQKMVEIAEAREQPLAISYAPPDASGPWSAGDKRHWHQAKIYPLIATGRIAGILSDAELSAIEHGAPIEILRSDGTRFTPELDPPDRAQFVADVKAGEFPLEVLRDMGVEVPDLKDAATSLAGFEAREAKRRRQPSQHQIS